MPLKFFSNSCLLFRNFFSNLCFNYLTGFSLLSGFVATNCLDLSVSSSRIKFKSALLPDISQSLLLAGSSDFYIAYKSLVTSSLQCKDRRSCPSTKDLELVTNLKKLAPKFRLTWLSSEIDVSTARYIAFKMLGYLRANNLQRAIECFFR